MTDFFLINSIKNIFSTKEEETVFKIPAGHDDTHQIFYEKPIQKETDAQNTEKKNNFLMAFINDLCMLCRLPSGSEALLEQILKRVCSNNMIYLDLVTKKQIAHALGYANSRTVDNKLQNLLKAKLLNKHSEQRALFELNPVFFTSNFGYYLQNEPFKIKLQIDYSEHKARSARIGIETDVSVSTSAHS